MTEKLPSMYKLTKKFEEAISMVDEDGVLTDEALDILDKAEMSIIEKSENIVKVIRSLEAKEKSMKDEKSYINSHQNIVKKNIEKLRGLLTLGLDKVAVKEGEEGKKTQKISMAKGSVYYTFKNNIEITPEEVEDKYKKKEVTLELSEKFDINTLKEIAPEMVQEVSTEVIDTQLLEFNYNRADEGKKPKGITMLETKTLNVRK